MRVLFLKLILLIPLTAHSVNVRVIGAGGGDSEMLALSRFSSFDDYANFCLSDTNPCQMTARHLSFLSEILRDFESLGEKPYLEFHDSSSPEFIFDHERKMISMSTTLLDSNFNRLNESQWMFIGVLKYMYGDRKDLWTTWVDLAESIYSELQWASHYINLHNQNRTLKFYDLDGRVNKGFVLSLDKAGEIEDLTSGIRDSIKCRNTPDILGFVSKPISLDQGFIAELQWGCGEDFHQGQVVGQIQSTGKWSFILHSVRDVSLCSRFLNP